MTLLLSGNHHTLSDALLVLDGPTEVDTSHGFKEYLQLLPLLHRRELDALLITHPVNLTDILPIEEDLRKVVPVIERQH